MPSSFSPSSSSYQPSSARNTHSANRNNLNSSSNRRQSMDDFDHVFKRARIDDRGQRYQYERSPQSNYSMYDPPMYEYNRDTYHEHDSFASNRSSVHERQQYYQDPVLTNAYSVTSFLNQENQQERTMYRTSEYQDTMMTSLHHSQESDIQPSYQQPTLHSEAHHSYSYPQTPYDHYHHPPGRRSSTESYQTDINHQESRAYRRHLHEPVPAAAIKSSSSVSSRNLHSLHSFETVNSPTPHSAYQEIIIKPNENDVLCGRGGGTNVHIGNRRFRAVVKEFKNEYIYAKKRDKPEVAEKVVNIIRAKSPPGRFLRKVRAPDGKWNWVDVGDAKAKEKTSQALREGAPNIRGRDTNDSDEKNSRSDTTTPEISKKNSQDYTPPSPSQKVSKVKILYPSPSPPNSLTDLDTNDATEVTKNQETFDRETKNVRREDSTTDRQQIDGQSSTSNTSFRTNNNKVDFFSPYISIAERTMKRVLEEDLSPEDKRLYAWFQPPETIAPRYPSQERNR